MNSDPNSAEEAKLLSKPSGFVISCAFTGRLDPILNLIRPRNYFGFFPKGKKRRPGLAMDSHVFPFSGC